MSVDLGQMVPQGDRAAVVTVGLDVSARELQVLSGMSYGLSNRAIARRLAVTEHTVKTHVRNLLRKLGARDRAHATRVGLELGLLTSSVERPAQPNSRAVGHPDAVPGFPVPTAWLPVPIPERPYTDGGHTPACILAPQCPCRRKKAQRAGAGDPR